MNMYSYFVEIFGFISFVCMKTLENTEVAINKLTVQRKWQHKIYKTKKKKTKKTQYKLYTTIVRSESYI